MQYSRTFLEENVTGAPLWVTSGTGAKVQQPVSLNRFLGDRGFLFTTPAFTLGSPETRARPAGTMISDVLGDAAIANVRVLFTFEMTAGGTLMSVSARQSGTSTSATGYFLDFDLVNNKVNLVKAVAGGETILASVPFVFNTANGTLYSVRFEVTGNAASTQLNGKVWLDSATTMVVEPTAWTVQATETVAVITTAGNASFGSGGVNVLLWYMCVGTGTDAAPAMPITWAQYLDFLDTQDAPVCVLYEVEVLSDNGSGGGVVGKLCFSNHAFTSKPSDRIAPNICYEEILKSAAKIKRRLSSTFTGFMDITYGDAIVANEVKNSDAPVMGEALTGKLDAWLSFNFDGRAVRELRGHPSWRRVDFKTGLLGTVSDIYRNGAQSLGFQFRGPEAVLANPVGSQTLIGGAGANAAALAPIATGNIFNATPISFDGALTYELGLAGFGHNILTGSYPGPALSSIDVRDQGVSLTQALRTITAVNTGTGVITFDAPHGVQIGGMVMFALGHALPAPLAVLTYYYVLTVPGSAQVTLSATLGGAAIVLTTATTGGLAEPFNFAVVNSGNHARLVLVVKPNGQVTYDINNGGATILSGIQFCLGLQGSDSPFYGSIEFFIDSFHSVSLPMPAEGYWPNQIQRGEALTTISGSVGAGIAMTREGGAYPVVVDIPGAVARWNVVADDIYNWRTGVRQLPKFVERLGYQKNYTQEQPAALAGSVSSANIDLYGRPYTLAGFTPSESTLEQPANHMLAVFPPERETLLVASSDAVTECTRLYNLYRKRTGTYIFSTDKYALAFDLGDVVNITYPRDGFANGKNAIVIGLEEDPGAGKVDVEVFCQVDGQWPVGPTAAQPYVSDAYYDIVASYILEEGSAGYILDEAGNPILEEGSIQ